MKYMYTLSYSDGKRNHHHEAAFTAKDDEGAIEELNSIIRNKFHYCCELIKLEDVRLMKVERIEFP